MYGPSPKSARLLRLRQATQSTQLSNPLSSSLPTDFRSKNIRLHANDVFLCLLLLVLDNKEDKAFNTWFDRSERSGYPSPTGRGASFLALRCARRAQGAPPALQPAMTILGSRYALDVAAVPVTPSSSARPLASATVAATGAAGDRRATWRRPAQASQRVGGANHTRTL